MGLKIILFVNIVLAFIVLGQELPRYEQSEKQLKLVIEFFRHGARGPLYDYLDTKQWPKSIPKEFLTPRGQRQQYILGRQVKENYRKELSIFSDFRPDKIKVYSTFTQRTIASAESQLFGMFENHYETISSKSFDEKLDLPPLKVPNWREYMDKLKYKPFPQPFQPVSIFSGDVNEKIMLPHEKCPALKNIVQENYHTELNKNFELYLHEAGFYKNFSEVFNITDPTMFNVEKMQEVFDTVVCDRYERRPLPEKLTQSLYDWMNFAYSFRQTFLQKGNETIFKYFATPAANAVLEQFKSNINGTDNITELVLYACHDDSLINLLLPLGIISYTTQFEEFMNPTRTFTHTNPIVSSQLFLELYEENKEFFVKAIYNGSPQKVRGCDNIYCKYSQFSQILQQNMVENWENLCSSEGFLEDKMTFMD